MADEQNNPTPVPTPFDPQTAPESIKETQDKTIRELRDVPVETVPDSKLAPEVQAVKEAESPDQRETRREGEDALNKPIEAIEDTVNAADMADQAQAAFHPMPHIPSDSTTLLGYTIPLPIYTVVYGILFAITILEVIVSSLPRGILGTAILIGLSACKAVLVVLFYMHLKDDSRVFAVALILPLFIALVSSLFLLTVPIKGY
jgi:caa(3)-type oxidase subunit IV